MLNTSLLVNLVGFAVGIALYGLLLVMVVRHREPRSRFGLDLLLLATAVLGLFWNIGEFVFFVVQDFGAAVVSPFFLAVSYSALGFLPSVVVHATWKNTDADNSYLRYLTLGAYGLSSLAAVLHFQSSIATGIAPSWVALRVLTFGSLAMLGGLLVLNFRQALERKALWAAALAIFAVSTLHLSSHAEESSWVVELLAHQSSLPLALAILVQEYRFAFADLFLKRALSLLLLSSLAFGLYVLIAVPLLKWHETHDRNDVQAAVVVLALWIGTALLYPLLHKIAVVFVDKVILRRADFDKLRNSIAEAVERAGEIEVVLEETASRLRGALAARGGSWSPVERQLSTLPDASVVPGGARIFVPTAEAPYFEISIDRLEGGRSLLSDELEMLRAVSLVAARRIDALRVTHERCELEIREQEFAKLATEAQLSALRAQVNPHFLFNALTTIGYLIQTAPDKAFDTLMRLTRLLRSVLKSTGEFSTLGEEIRLIENYLDIEKARFEERLAVRIDVPRELESVRIPALVLQPLVENAIKHGVSENKNGGEVAITAEMTSAEGDRELRLLVTDTGPGRRGAASKHSNGVGLKNIRERLRSHYGPRAGLRVESDAQEGTRAEIVLPVLN